ncbi:MAG: TM2 domain-containing protein [Moraxella sp.]|nr:TM2 domain-containing protein [Moraxella sp.]
MKGKILGYNKESQTGVISAEDGKRYQFKSADWKSPQSPIANASVDFEISGESAIEIYKVGGSNINLEGVGQKKIVAALLAFFLGSLGVHKFYLGYNKQGFIMLGCFLFGFILVGIPSAIIAIIALIESVLYLTKSDDAFEEMYIKNQRPWF